MKRLIFISLIAASAGVILLVYVAGMPFSFGEGYGMTATSLYFLLAVGALFVVRFLYEKSQQTKNRNSENGNYNGTETIHDIVDRYGQPDDSTIVDATKPDTAANVILYYDREGFIVADGKPISKKDIVDITCNNAAIVYMPNDYQIMFTVRDHSGKTRIIRVYSGCDMTHTVETVAGIKRHIIQ